MTLLAGALLVAFLLALASTALLSRARVGSGRIAAEERWRTDAVSRIGGVAILLGFLAGAAILALGGRLHPTEAAGFVAAAALIAVVGIWDDLRGLRPLHKLIGQILAATILLATGTTVEIIDIQPLSSALVIFWVIAITNAFNLLDNMDGLAAGVGLVAALAIAGHAHLGDLGAVA